jgi:acyl-CoA thioesterase I
MRTIVGIGASIVQATVSHDWLNEVAQAMGPDVKVVNCGKNGDLAWNVLQRIDAVLAHQPSDAIVLVGSNDVNGAVDPRAGKAYVRWKRLPKLPTAEWYEASLAAVLERLRGAGVRTAVSSLPYIGDDPASKLNETVVYYNQIIRTVAGRMGATYLPFFEALGALVPATVARPRDRVSMALMLAAVVRRRVLKQSYDAISRAHGLKLTTDMLHLNETSARPLVDLALSFLRPA